MKAMLRIHLIAGLVVAAALLLPSLGTLPGAGAQQSSSQPAEAGLKTPEPLRIEHQRLYQQLADAQRAGGKTGVAAENVAQAMKPHFEVEERIAMPVLGLLSRVSKGEVTPEMRQVLPLSDQLKEQLAKMLEEHREITAALNDLKKAAQEEGKQEVAAFAQRLMLHAQIEEEVLYPAAILVGEYVRLKLDAQQGPQ